MAEPEVSKELPKLEEPQVEELDDLDLDDIDLTPRKSGLSKEASGGRTENEIFWRIKKSYAYDPRLTKAIIAPHLLYYLVDLTGYLKPKGPNRFDDNNLEHTRVLIRVHVVSFLSV